MACEARIVRVLRTMEYPGLDDSSGAPTMAPISLADRPDELAKIVGWLEDRKVRGLPIASREPLRTPGPKWEAAFFSYLQEMGYPNDLKPTGQGLSGGEADSAVLRGLSWLVTEAVACDFEDNGKGYMAAVRELLSVPHDANTARSSRQSEPVQLSGDVCATAVVAMDDDVSEGGSRVFHELQGFAAGVETGDDVCDSVATVLRMLFLSDMRSLQDEVNGVITLAQSMRVEPKPKPV